MALIQAGADLRNVDPLTGVMVLDLFRARQAKRDLEGREAEGAELDLGRILGEPMSTPGQPGRQTNAEGSGRLPDEPATGKSVRGGGVTWSGASELAPLLGLSFEDPEDSVAKPWNVLRGKERESFLELVRQSDAKLELKTESTQVLWARIPFYDRVTLVRVRDRSWTQPRLSFFYLTDGDNLFRLDGTSPPIHEVNAKAPIRLNRLNVVDYVRFFGFFVRGGEGPYYILESADDAALAPMPEDIRENLIKDIARPAKLDGINERGHFLVQAVVAYSNALFLANFVVQPTGLIEMASDEPLAADLPNQLIDAPIS